MIFQWNKTLEDVSVMCNLSQKIKETGIETGIEIGKRNDCKNAQQGLYNRSDR